MEERRMKKSSLLFGLILASIVILASCTQQKINVENLPVSDVTVFKSPTCGCCGIYSQYMEKEGFQVKVEDVPTMDYIKKEFNIPSQLQSCHITQIGEYFVEGHVPLEVIDKLLTENPDIAGIAMPGMPSGSPGMPGRKTGPWTIYAVNHDGSYAEFITI
jgi:hypothetical protein